jgi:hypothetical protein
MAREKKREEKKEKGRIRVEGIGSFQSIADMHCISGCTGQDNQSQGLDKTRQDKRVAAWIRIPMLHQLRGAFVCLDLNPLNYSPRSKIPCLPGLIHILIRQWLFRTNAGSLLEPCLPSPFAIALEVKKRFDS